MSSNVIKTYHLPKNYKLLPDAFLVTTCKCTQNKLHCIFMSLYICKSTIFFVKIEIKYIFLLLKSKTINTFLVLLDIVFSQCFIYHSLNITFRKWYLNLSFLVKLWVSLFVQYSWFFIYAKHCKKLSLIHKNCLW